MVRKLMPRALAALAAFALALPALAAESDSLTADEVIARYVAARGGADKLASVKSARLTGKRAMGQGMDAPFTVEWKRPNKFRLEFTFQGQTGVQAFDGEIGWMLMPFLGQTGPERMPDAMTQEVKDGADFLGPLVDYKEKGNKVELVGTEDVEGTPAYHLKVTLKSGRVVDAYIDTEYNLEIKSTTTSSAMGQEQEVETTLGDYKEVDGLVMPFSMEVKPPGAPQGQVITIDKVELNVDIPDSDFAMPEAPEPAAAPAQPAAPPAAG